MYVPNITHVAESNCQLHGLWFQQREVETTLPLFVVDVGWLNADCWYLGNDIPFWRAAKL